MRVWIDLANSPHPLLFRPIARRLEEEGAEVLVTVRDHAQTRELASAAWPDAEVIGDVSPGGRAGKFKALGGRIAALASWARANRPSVALSHNSYAQIVAARIAWIPVLTAMDYEHQPANHLGFRLADRIMVPEALPVTELARQGARARKLVRYPGYKEQIYLADFEPDPQILGSLGLAESDPTGRIVVARAAPAGAAYHREENPMFERLVFDLDRSGSYRTVVLARHPEQRLAFDREELSRTVVPADAIDTRSLLCAADAFVGAGGTMTREAALLGTPAFSVFAGRDAAADRQLVREGRLTMIGGAASPLTAIEEALRQRARPTAAERGKRLGELREAGERIIEIFVDNALELGSTGARR